MPSPVPAGYTRGPILFIGSASTPESESRLLQRFWQEAGAYGARIVLIASGQGGMQRAEHARTLFAEWECDSVTMVAVETRGEALRPQSLDAIPSSTGILLCGESAVRLASVLGGTPLAQAVRRANAQNKAVGAIGAGGSVLCQHMVATDRKIDGATPFLHRDLIQFAPGLGLVNRLLLDADSADGVRGPNAIHRLLAAVAYNPFLVGAGLGRDAGIVIYPNSVLEVFGENSVLLVDGSQLQQTNLHEADAGAPVNLFGVQLHVLTQGCTFSFDSRAVAAPAPGDLSLQTEALRAAF